MSAAAAAYKNQFNYSRTYFSRTRIVFNNGNG